MPKTILTEDSATILLTMQVDCLPGECPGQIEVDLLDKNQQAVKARLQMMDNGLLGDAIPGDHIYSRKVEMKENHARKVVFSVAPDNTATIDVLWRPTFLEMLQQIWQKISAKYFR
ncbi:MAG: hypothetical protein Q7T03_07550 [Deltaproteobacteria bacterium]|nr:hypothetical protein [Deltaproteobacteria bacterium]